MILWNRLVKFYFDYFHLEEAYLKIKEPGLHWRRGVQVLRSDREKRLSNPESSFKRLVHITFGIQTENKVRSSFTIEIGDWLHFDFRCAAMLETFEMSKAKNYGNVKE